MERILRRVAGRFGIRLAPLKIPIERRLQTFAVLFYLNCVFIIPFFGFLLLFIALFTPFWILSVGYVFWMVYDMKIAKTPPKRWSQILVVEGRKDGSLGTRLFPNNFD